MAGRTEAATESRTYYLDRREKDHTDFRGNVWTKVWKSCCGRIGARSARRCRTRPTPAGPTGP